MSTDITLGTPGDEQPKKRPYQSVSFAVNLPNFTAPEMRAVKASGGYMTYGADNKYPISLWNMFRQSSLHKAIIKRKIKEIVANGLISTLPGVKKLIEKCNRKGDSLDDVFKKITRDYLIFGGFSLHIIFGKASNKIEEIYYMPISKLRYNSDLDKIKYAKDWSLGKVKTIEYNLYEEGVTTGECIFYYPGEDTADFYPEPEYSGSLADIQTSVLISDLNLSTINNGMLPSLIVNLKNGIPTPEEQGQIEKDLNKKFGGSSNAGKIILNFSENGSDSSLEVDPIQQPDLVARYIALQNTTRDNIIIGHQLSSAALFAVQTPGQLGQNGDPSEDLEIFQKTYVIPQQNILLKIFNRLLSVNFPKCDLKVTPLEPIGNFFTDQILISSMMTNKEIRTKLKEDGWIENIDIPAGEKLRVDDSPLSKVDTSDKQLEEPPKDDSVDPENPEKDNSTKD